MLLPNNPKEQLPSGITPQQVVDELGVNQATVNRDLCRNTVYTEKVQQPRRKVTVLQINSGTKPKTAADTIREKFGDAFADELKELLKTQFQKLIFI